MTTRHSPPKNSKYIITNDQEKIQRRRKTTLLGHRSTLPLHQMIFYIKQIITPEVFKHNKSRHKSHILAEPQLNEPVQPPSQIPKQEANLVSYQVSNNLANNNNDQYTNQYRNRYNNNNNYGRNNYNNNNSWRGQSNWRNNNNNNYGRNNYRGRGRRNNNNNYNSNNSNNNNNNNTKKPTNLAAINIPDNITPSSSISQIVPQPSSSIGHHNQKVQDQWRSLTSHEDNKEQSVIQQVQHVPSPKSTHSVPHQEIPQEDHNLDVLDQELHFGNPDDYTHVKINTISLLQNTHFPSINQISSLGMSNVTPCMDIITMNKEFIQVTPTLIDTGASVSCINQYTADALRLQTTPFNIQLADSSTKQIKIASTPINIKIARTLYNIRALILPGQNLLGQDIIMNSATKFYKDKHNILHINNMNCTNFIQSSLNSSTIHLVQHPLIFNIPPQTTTTLDFHSNNITYLPKANCDAYEIKLRPDHTHTCTKYRIRNPIDEHVIERQVIEWINQGIIQKSVSSWSSPIVLVRKSDNSMRLCINFKHLNKYTISPPSILPDIKNIINNAARYNFKSEIDLKSAFLQSALHNNSTQLTAFSCSLGHFEFLRMPFGLTGAPQHFQSQLEQQLRQLPEFNFTSVFG